jgi:hypothetical protein
LLGKRFVPAFMGATGSPAFAVGGPIVPVQLVWICQTGFAIRRAWRPGHLISMNLDNLATAVSSDHELEPAHGSDHRSHLSPAERFALVIGATVAAVGLVVMAGWHLRITALIVLVPGFSRMQYATAVMLVVAGLGLMALETGRRRLATALGAAVLTMGAMVVLEYATGWDTLIDHLRTSWAVPGPSGIAGRPALAMGASILGIGVALVASARRGGSLTSRRAALFGLVVPMLVAVPSLVGVLFGLVGTPAWRNTVSVAPHGAAAVFLLSAGLIARLLAGDRSGALKRDPFLAFAVGLLCAAASAGLWYSLSYEYDRVLAAGTGRPGRSSAWTYLVLVLGVTLGAAVTVAVRMAQISRARADSLDQTNARLVVEAAAREQAVVQLEAALSEVRELSGFLPICAYCKRIRDEADYWQHLESYIASRTRAQFSHGVCPACYAKHVGPELAAADIDAESDDAPTRDTGKP